MKHFCDIIKLSGYDLPIAVTKLRFPETEN